MLLPHGQVWCCFGGQHACPDAVCVWLLVVGVRQAMAVWRGKWRKEPEPHVAADDGEIEIPGR